MEHRWIGRPADARGWYDEKRRHAPFYVAIGGTTIVVGLLVARWRWDSLDHLARWMGITMVLAFGGTVLAFGPLLYYISDKHTVYLVLPMREGWRQALGTTSSALTGYLSSRGVRWRTLRSFTRQGVVLGLDEGLRIMIIVSDVEKGGGRRIEFMVSIHRIKESNVGLAEKVQRILDEWPLLEELEAGVDVETAEAYMEM